VNDDKSGDFSPYSKGRNFIHRVNSKWILWLYLNDEINNREVMLVVLFTNFVSLTVRFTLVWLLLKFDCGCFCWVCAFI